MSDFTINIDSKLDLSKARSEMNSFLSEFKNEPIKVKVDVDKSSLSKVNGQKIVINPSVNTSGIQQATAKIKSQISAQKIQFKVDTGQTIADIAKIEAKMKNLGSSNYIKSSEFQNAYNVLEKFKNTKLDSSNIDQYNIALKTCQNYIQAASADLSTMATESQRITLKSNLQKTLKENSAYTKEAKAKLKSYIDEIEQLGSTMTKLDYTRISNGLKEVNSNMISQGRVGKNWIEEMGRGMKVIGQFATTYGIIHRIPETIMNMANAVIEVDTAMTNLYKVTDETDAKYSEFLSNASKNAKSLGRDISSYITQTSEWAKLGYNMNSSSELAKVSSIYANVGEVDDKTAVSDLVTVMKAYNMQDSQAMNIADMLNELGNNYATSAGDLGAGLTKMASTMSMSNVSLEKSLAILTGGTEITQNAEELGNAIKISVLRMRGQKGKLESLGENADDIESVSKMQTQILNMTKGAVNIMDSADPTKFRDYYDVMSDIAEILPKLNQTDQSNLIETLFGKNRANQGQAILQAFQSGQIQKAYQTALNSAGSAQKEQDRWLQSAEAKIQQFKAQFQSLSTTAIDSNIFKGLIDSGTTLLNILTQLIDVGGGIPLMLGAIGGTAFIKNLDLFYFKLVTSYKRMQRKWCCKQLCVVTF